MVQILYINLSPVHNTNFLLFIFNEKLTYDRGRSFFSLYKANKETLATLTTCNGKKKQIQPHSKKKLSTTLILVFYQLQKQ